MGGKIEINGGVFAFLLICSAQAHPPDSDWKTAYAVVGGEPVERARVDEDVKRGIPKTQAIQRRVTLIVLAQNLRKVGQDPSKVSEAEIQTAWAEACRGWRARGLKPVDVLRRLGQTEGKFRQGLRLSLCFRNYIRSTLTEERLRQLYAEHALAMVGEIRASHLFVRVTKDRSRTQARQRAKRLLADLQKNPNLAAFSDLAQRESDDPMASLTAGDLDWFTVRGNRQIPEAVVREAFAWKKVGLIPKVVETSNGFHVVWIARTRLPKSASFERHRQHVRQRAEALEVRQTMKAWLKRTPIAYAPDVPAGLKRKQ